jgi:hypothetical protein
LKAPVGFVFSRINDGLSKAFPLFVGHFRHAGARALFCTEVRQLSKYRSVEPCLALSVQHLKPGHQIALLKGDSSSTRHSSSTGAFMLRIERSANGQVVFSLSGRMQTENIQQFQQLLVGETPGQQLMFNLQHVTLVNQDAVTFLADCEANVITLENCPLYVRNWIDQEKRRNRRRRMRKRDTKWPQTSPG